MSRIEEPLEKGWLGQVIRDVQKRWFNLALRVRAFLSIVKTSRLVGKPRSIQSTHHQPGVLNKITFSDLSSTVTGEM